MFFDRGYFNVGLLDQLIVDIVDELFMFGFDKYFCFFNDDDDEDFFYVIKYEYIFYINIVYEF